MSIPVRSVSLVTAFAAHLISLLTVCEKAVPAEGCTERVCTHSNVDLTNDSTATSPGAHAPVPPTGVEDGQNG